MARFQVRAEEDRATMPVCAMWDTVEIGQSASLGAGVTRESTFALVSGFRRYRLKIVQLTGAGPTAVSAVDIPFSRIVANAWEVAVLAAAMATGVRSVFNFGEGTAILTNFMGPYLDIRLTNNGGNAATYEIELWAQG
jgi:hypothetical protein